MSGSMGVMEGMLWASLVMVGVPLLVGIGVAILLLRRRPGRREGRTDQARMG